MRKGSISERELTDRPRPVSATKFIRRSSQESFANEESRMYKKYTPLQHSDVERLIAPYR